MSASMYATANRRLVLFITTSFWVVLALGKEVREYDAFVSPLFVGMFQINNAKFLKPGILLLFCALTLESPLFKVRCDAKKSSFKMPLFFG